MLEIAKKNFQDHQVSNVPHSWQNFFWSPIEGSKRLFQMLQGDFSAVQPRAELYWSQNKVLVHNGSRLLDWVYVLDDA